MAKFVVTGWSLINVEDLAQVSYGLCTKALIIRARNHAGAGQNRLTGAAVYDSFFIVFRENDMAERAFRELTAFIGEPSRVTFDFRHYGMVTGEYEIRANRESDECPCPVPPPADMAENARIREEASAV